MEMIEQLKEIKTLLVVNDPMFLDEMELAFEESGLYLRAYNTAEMALEAMKLEEFDAIICCNELPKLSGLKFFRQIRKSHPDTIKILCGETSDTAIVAESFQHRRDPKLPRFGFFLDGCYHTIRYIEMIDTTAGR